MGHTSRYLIVVLCPVTSVARTAWTAKRQSADMDILITSVFVAIMVLLVLFVFKNNPECGGYDFEGVQHLTLCPRCGKPRDRG